MRSDVDTSPTSWVSYSPTSLDLGETPQGEIDAHVFRDTDGKMYLFWKTDDNSVGLKATRLFAQEIAVTAKEVTLVGDKQEVLDSTGMYWVTSWVDGGSLIEAPEVVKHGAYYYLFFANGRYESVSFVYIYFYPPFFLKKKRYLHIYIPFLFA